MAKRHAGQPTKYKPEYCQNLIDFFSIERVIYTTITTNNKDGTVTKKLVPEAAPTPYFADWAKKIGVEKMTMLNWTREHPKFFDAYKKAKDLQEAFLAECALKNLHNPVFTMFAMKNMCGWRDEQYLKGDVSHNVFYEEVIAKPIRNLSLTHASTN